MSFSLMHQLIVVLGLFLYDDNSAPQWSECDNADDDYERMSPTICITLNTHLHSVMQNHCATVLLQNYYSSFVKTKKTVSK